MTKAKKESTEYTVQAVNNAISILEALGDSEHEQSIQEVYSKLSLTKSNASKLLATLEKFDYVESNKYTGNFRLGVKTFQIAQAYINKLSMTEVSLPVIKALRDKVQESAYVGVLRRENVVYINMAQTSAPVRVVSQIGHVAAAYATATGKIQLAALEDSDVESLYPGPLQKFTPHTKDNLDELIKELAHIRETGYAVDDEEYDQEVKCVSVPVKDFMGNTIAGMTICAPKERLQEQRITSEIFPALKEAAVALSIKFGYMVK